MGAAFASGVNTPYVEYSRFASRDARACTARVFGPYYMSEVEYEHVCTDSSTHVHVATVLGSSASSDARPCSAAAAVQDLDMASRTTR